MKTIITKEEFISKMGMNMEYSSYFEQSEYEVFFAELYEELNSILKELKLPTLFYEGLAKVGGQRPYHQEGNALVHTLLVAGHCYVHTPCHPDNWFTKLGLLHDIGKIFTSWLDLESGDWKYPNHSIEGAKREVLSRFISEENPYFESYQWFIKNHIKPMFFKDEADADRKLKYILEDAPSDICTAPNLLLLVYCDLLGSKGEEDNSKTLELIGSLMVKYSNN